MFHSLRARLLAAFAVLGLAFLICVGGALFVVLRDLNERSQEAALSEALVPFVAQARTRLAAGAAPAQVVTTLRSVAAGTAAAVFLTDDSGAVIAADGSPAPTGITIPDAQRRGIVSSGTYRLGDQAYQYVAATLFADATPGGARALVLALPDRATAEAVGDLWRGLLVAAVALLVIGVPLATLLAREVSRPLERLGVAAREIGRGTLPPPLPAAGPREVADASLAFNTMTAEVAHARVAQADILAGLRHDLRTPLTVIGGFARALQDGTASGDETGRAAGAIVEEADRLDRMVADLGALADLETGGRPLQLEQLDAGVLARRAAERFAPAAAADGQVVTAAAETMPLPLAGDRVAVERILGNLVGNALAAAPRPGGHARIEVMPLPGDAVMLAVADDGPGIPPAALPRIFERFYRADPARAGGGSGLGLSIVEQLARAHGGRAFAENTPGGGARVGVILPALPVLPPGGGTT